jgi:hypothetical protein
MTTLILIFFSVNLLSFTVIIQSCSNLCLEYCFRENFDLYWFISHSNKQYRGSNGNARTYDTYILGTSKLKSWKPNYSYQNPWCSAKFATDIINYGLTWAVLCCKQTSSHLCPGFLIDQITPWIASFRNILIDIHEWYFCF